MNAFLVSAIAVVAAVAAQIALPGRWVYHAGWYNVALGAAIISAIAAARRYFQRTPSLRRRAAIAAVAFGVAAMGLAGIVNGLFGPDDRDVIGAPGQQVSVEGCGTLQFPLASQDPKSPGLVTLARPLHAALQIGLRGRDTGSFILRARPRSVVYVTARDLRGDHLTVTQPEGTEFLSPVLLMQHRQMIAGMDLPFDSFSVPAAHRAVKAILFTPAQAAVMLRGTGVPGQSAVLFAVDNEDDRPLPHGIALSVAGRVVAVGGISLRADVRSYPEITVVSAPNIVAVTFGTLLVLAGLVALLVLKSGG